MQKKHGKTSRKKREAKGRRAEFFASIWLKLKGYYILDMRVRMHTGEIDIIAKKGKLIAFVEVKARKTTQIGQRSVTDHSWRRISRTAEIWMSHKRKFTGHDWRYDLVVISPLALPVHFRDYWRP